MEQRGLPASQLSDDDLERQGRQAHATRHWVFLHGTAEQFRRHTERMLELEQEYLRRHPKRTWQGTAPGASGGDTVELDRKLWLRQLLRGFTRSSTCSARTSRRRFRWARARTSGRCWSGSPPPTGGGCTSWRPNQLARELRASPAAVAGLYRHDPPLLATAGSDRFLTDAGRAWLTDRS